MSEKLTMTVELDEQGVVDTLVFGDADEKLAADLFRDFRDGAALRRLREALPVASGKHAYVDAIWNGRPDASFVVVANVYGDAPKGWRGNGATIAEAADKCREALDAQNDTQ
jgi:hypothetical protein